MTNSELGRRKVLKTGGIATAVGLAGCLSGGSTDSSGDPDYTDITVTSWGGVAAETTREIFLEPFEEEHGVEVGLEEHSNAFDVLQQIRSGIDINGGVIDHFALNEAYEEGLLAPVDEGVTDAMEIFDDSFQNPNWDPGEETHAVVSSLFIGSAFYNANVVSDASTWDDILLNDDLSGDLGLLGNAAHYPPYTMAFSEGINLNDLADIDDEDEVEEFMEPVWDKVEQVADRVEAFTNDGNVQNLIANGSISAGQLAVADTLIVDEEQDDPFEPYIPEGGVWGDVSPWAIFSETSSEDEIFTMSRLLESTLDVDRRGAYATELPYFQAVNWDGDNPIPDNPETEHPDRVVVPDVEVVNEYREDWLQTFETIIN